MTAPSSILPAPSAAARERPAPPPRDPRPRGPSPWRRWGALAAARRQARTAADALVAVAGT